MQQDRKIYKTFIIDALLLGSTLLFFVILTWGKWLHPLIDFGREVYIPWRINNGEVLYRDLAYLFGPLPPYWNAFLFSIFGPSITTLCVFNLIVVILDVILLYRLFFCIYGRCVAFFTSLFFLIFFVMGTHFHTYNLYYLAPYSHSYAYAICFVLAAFNLFILASSKVKLGWFFITGVCAGFAAISRIEIFLTFFIPLIGGIVLQGWKQRWTMLFELRTLGVLSLGAFLPLLVCLIYFLQFYSLQEAVRLVLGYNHQWLSVYNSTFYQHVTGFFNSSTNIQLLLASLIWYALIFLCFELFGTALKFIRFGKIKNAVLLILVFTYVYTHAGFWAASHNFIHITRGQAVLVALMLWFYLKNYLFDKEIQHTGRFLVMIIFCGWSLLMMSRIPLNLFLKYYGLIYGLPGVMVCLIIFIHELPVKLENRYRSGSPARVLILTLVVVAMIFSLLSSLAWMSHKNKIINQGANTIIAIGKPFAYRAGENTEEFIDWSISHMRSDDTFVVLPEGVMLNFLTKHKITGKFVTYMPPEMITYSEEVMLHSLMDNPPDFIVLNNREMLTYGGQIGKKFGVRLMEWVNDNYQPLHYIGKDLRIGYGLGILRKK